MKNNSRRIVALLAATAFTVNGCATTGALSLGTSYANPKERQILYQAVGVGAAAGAATGALIGNQLGGRNRAVGTLVGALAGAAIGGAIGHFAGSGQIKKYRDVRLKNDQLAALLKTAQDYNNDIAAYNLHLEREIASLERKSGKQRAELASAERAVAEKRRAGVAKQLSERRELAQALAPEQRQQLEQKVDTLSQELNRLDAGIVRMRGLESVKVG